jgi:hypothetical protein
MSDSLIGRSGSSAFRLSTTAMSMSLAGSRFSRLRTAISRRCDRSRPIGTWRRSIQTPPRLIWIYGSGQSRTRRLQTERRFSSINHGPGCRHLVKAACRRRLNVDDDSAFEIDQIVEATAKLDPFVRRSPVPENGTTSLSSIVLSVIFFWSYCCRIKGIVARQEFMGRCRALDFRRGSVTERLRGINERREVGLWHLTDIPSEPTKGAGSTGRYAPISPSHNPQRKP